MGYSPWGPKELDTAEHRTVAQQAPQSMRFSRQEYWSGLLFPGGLQVIFLTQGLNQHLLWLLLCRQILHQCATCYSQPMGLQK